MYVFEDTEPNGEAGQVLMMDQKLHVRIEICVYVCVRANVCQCVHLIIVCILTYNLYNYYIKLSSVML